MAHHRKHSQEQLPMSSSSKSTAPAQSEYVLIDYDGRCGNNHAHVHHGSYTENTGAPALMLHPGLNIKDRAAFEAARQRGPIARRINDRRIKIVSEDLREYAADADRMDLAKRTQDAKALEHMRAVELARPQSGAFGQRRDPEIVALLDAKIPAMVRRRVPDLANLGPALDQRIAVMMRGFKQAAANG
jgi:hypothetical protein